MNVSMPRLASFILLVFSLLPVTARAEDATPKVQVVATFSILADLAREVGGNRMEVSSLVGPNGDAHEFQPSPTDARRIVGAQVVIVNGLGLEGWIDRLIAAAGARRRVVVASVGVQPFAEVEPDPKGPGRIARLDPHAWQDVGNARIYVSNIKDALIRIDPAGTAAYEANAARYGAELDDLERDIRATIAAIPSANRVIITTHDAFGYFGRAYGMRFVAPQGVSTESEASAKDVARIIRQIRAEKIPAAFLENVSDPRLMAQIAQESGARLGRKLYSDALSEPGGPAATYLTMMRNNIAAFREALAP